MFLGAQYKRKICNYRSFVNSEKFCTFNTKLHEAEMVAQNKMKYTGFE